MTEGAAGRGWVRGRDHREGHKEREGCDEEKVTTESTESTEGGHIGGQVPGVLWDREFSLSAATRSGRGSRREAEVEVERKRRRESEGGGGLFRSEAPGGHRWDSPGGRMDRPLRGKGPGGKGGRKENGGKENSRLSVVGSEAMEG